MMSNIGYLPYSKDVNGYVNDYTWIKFMKQWTGYSPTVIDAAAFAEIDEVKQMPSYPDDGSIAIINDTVVVKFQNDVVTSGTFSHNSVYRGNLLQKMSDSMLWDVIFIDMGWQFH